MPASRPELSGPRRRGGPRGPRIRPATGSFGDLRPFEGYRFTVEQLRSMSRDGRAPAGDRRASCCPRPLEERARGHGPARHGRRHRIADQRGHASASMRGHGFERDRPHPGGRLQVRPLARPRLHAAPPRPPSRLTAAGPDARARRMRAGHLPLSRHLAPPRRQARRQCPGAAADRHARACPTPCETALPRPRMGARQAPLPAERSSISTSERSDRLLEPPWPDLVLTVGRRPTMAALWVRERSGGRTRLVVVGRPRRRLDDYDLVVVPPQYHVPAAPNVVRSWTCR